MPDIAAAADGLRPCLGIQALGLCGYDPTKPYSVYFSLGEVVGALAFTLAVAELLKPIHRFRLSARYLSLRRLYIAVFFGVFCVFVSAAVPHFPVLHGGPWGYAVVWECMAATAFVFAYAAVVLAVAVPVKVRERNITKFAQSAANLLASAGEQDHIEFCADLSQSLPALIASAASVEGLRFREPSAFYLFTFRHQIGRAQYAQSFLRILADPAFCKTAINRTPWQVARVLKKLSEKYLHAEAAEDFVIQLARQAILSDDGMMERETGYEGFAVAPLLSDALFSDPFIVGTYNPYGMMFLSNDTITGPILKRFNSAAKRSLTALIDEHAQANTAYSIHTFYERAFGQAWYFRKRKEESIDLPMQIHWGSEMVINMSARFLRETDDATYEWSFVDDPKAHRHDLLETLVETTYEALASISNKFEGVDDPFWMTAIHVVTHAFPNVGEQPDGLNPFQQRLLLLIDDKLANNMDGYYPAMARVLLATVGPYQHSGRQKNRTAFIILKDVLYSQLIKFPQLAKDKPEKSEDFLPPMTTYDPGARRLTHTYRGGQKVVTVLSTLSIPPVDLLDKALRTPRDLAIPALRGY